MRRNILYSLLGFVFISCSQNAKEGLDIPTLEVDITTPKEVTFDELFSKAELIPLETNDSCFIINIEKVIPYENKIMVFDNVKPVLYIFSDTGSFLKQISQKGNGPGEYQTFVDAYWDDSTKRLAVLVPFGYVLIYDIDGNYIGKQVLPLKPNYFSLTKLKDGEWVTWSCVEEEDDGILVLDNSMQNIMYSTWNYDRILDMGLTAPFYQYDGKTFFSTAYENIVYTLDKNSLTPSYRWDFGDKNIKKNNLTKYSNIENSSARNKKILKDLSEGVIPFVMEKNNQNKKYYYVALRKGVGRHRAWINIFQDKSNKKNFVFERLSSFIPVQPVYFSDDYLITLVDMEHIEPYKSILPESDYITLQGKRHEDNVYLIKLYFK